MSTDVTGLPLVKAFNSEVFPLDRLDPGSDLMEFLSKILVTEREDEIFDPGPGGRFEIGLTVEDEAVLNLVGLEGFALVFGGASTTSIRFGLSLWPDRWEALLGAGLRLRFPRNILKPVMRDGDRWVDDPSREYAEIHISAGIILDQDWNVNFDGSNAFRLDAAMIADSGLVIEGELALDLSESTSLPESTALGLGPEWRGVVFKSLNVYLPDAITEAVPISSLSFENFHIGSGGVSGAIRLNGTPGDGTIGGFPFRPTSLEVELIQNCLVKAEIGGQLTLSFFDGPVDVVAGFDLDGNFTVELGSSTGIVELTKPGILTLSVDGMKLAHEEGVFTVGLSGSITPLIGDLDWPGFKIEELSIDSEGHVQIEGGWLNLRDQYSLDFYGFNVEISRFGLGHTDDGGKWIGFSGGIKLVDGLSIGGSVDGLKITWYDDGSTDITLEGVGVELEIPGTLRFKGEVSFMELDGQKRFDGDITLDLMAIGLRLDGKIVIGTATHPDTGEYTFFALYVGLELPAGIPLWSTGLGIYGLAGLLAIQMAPNKGAAPNALHPSSRTDEEWFENLDGSPGWYKRDVVGITDLRGKWDPVKDGFALGAGVTIGTLPDNGFTFNGSLLLAITFPGPVILLEGKANMLKERSKLNDNPIFRAIVVLDFHAGNFLIGLAANYKFGDGGELIDIGGSAEVFFDFADASKWHLYLGRDDPKEARIRAQILSLFEANAYFMIDARQLKTGAWVGYDKSWHFGPLSLVVEAWLEGGVVISWKPAFFHGHLWLHGRAELSIFGIGIGMHVDARFAADVFDPFHLLAEFSVGISLPWPLPDFDVDVTLEWGPTPETPPLPMPLKEIAIEHFKSTASWPLPRAGLLLPDVDAGEGFLKLPPPAADLNAGPPPDTPVVPMDARPHLTFGRMVHDDALVGVNPQPVWPRADPIGWERIGDPELNQGPMRLRFALKELVLAKRDGNAWIDIASKGDTSNSTGLNELFGSWAPMPQLPSGTTAPGTDPPTAQVKLWLWSKTPFDYTQHGGAAWDEWFTDTFTEYPCIPAVPERTICCDFDQLMAGSVLTLPMPCRRHNEIVIVGSTEGTVTQLAQPSHGHVHALCWDPVQSDRQAVFAIILTGDPASRMTLAFAGRGEEWITHCLDLETDSTREYKFPLERKGMRVRIFDRNGKPIKTAARQQVNHHVGFNIGYHAEIIFPCVTDRVEVTVWQDVQPVIVTAYDTRGNLTVTATGPDRQGLVTLILRHAGMARLVIDTPGEKTYLLQICVVCTTESSPEVQVTGIDTDNIHHGPFLPGGDKVTVEVEKLRSVIVKGRGRVCLIEVCVTFPPDGNAVAAREEMIERLNDAMAVWGDTGEVLEPDTNYRLKIVTKVEGIGEGPLAGENPIHTVTELAYFKTEGPPGLVSLSTPLHHPPEEPFDSGLDDLTRYVEQTVPPTVPGAGEQTPLPRPVYRGYDVGVLFNEDYVDLMYRLAKRDLGLYLFDTNNEPARDAGGRLIVSPNRWGVTESLTLSESVVRYLNILDQATCVAADPEIIPHHVNLFTVDPGLVLSPDTVYEARLIPLLMHEDFKEGLGGWTVVDGGTNESPSHWDTVGHPTLKGEDATAAGTEVTLTGAEDLTVLDTACDVVVLSTDTAHERKTYRIIDVNNVAKMVRVDGHPILFTGKSNWKIPGYGRAIQSSNIWGGEMAAESVPKPGTMLIGGNASWDDYRYSVQVRSSDDDALGVVFRYMGENDYYRFSMDRERMYRRLVRVHNGAYRVLAEDDFVHVLDRDYLITVEAIGSSLRIYLDREIVFDVVDEAHDKGRIGFYCWGNPGVEFSDVRVDDFRKNAPVPYRFSFTTSKFVDFFHHLHSFQDETWITEAQDGDLADDVAEAVPLGADVTDAETRAFTALSEKVLGSSARTLVNELEIHRIMVGVDPVALLVRSPEPIDWTRTALKIQRAGGLVDTPGVPGDMKITDISTGGTTPNDESVTVLTRQSLSLARKALETYGIPGPLAGTASGVLIDDIFDTPGGVFFEETFGQNALDLYTIVDAPDATSGPSNWEVTGGAIVQKSNIYGGQFSGSDPAKPGTVAVTGGKWRDIRLTARLYSGDNDAIGIVFRYADNDHWYRFSMDHQGGYRRLVKNVGGAVTTLWEDGILYDTDRSYELQIDAYHNFLVGRLDRMLLFIVQDTDVVEGRVGLYARGNVDARFEALRVESLSSGPLLFQAPFEEIDEVEIVDQGTTDVPSAWTMTGGEVLQTSSIRGPSPPPGVLEPGTTALLQPVFSDLELSVKLVSDNDGAIGVVFRYQDPDNWYRFSMDRSGAYRRLVRNLAGTQTILWQDSVAYTAGRVYSLTIVATGRKLFGWLDGTLLFEREDAHFSNGRVGVYCSNNDGARFASLVVSDPVRRIGNWRLIDEAPWPTPSGWRMANGVLRQTSNIHEGALPEGRGTIALGGQATWSDYRIALDLRSDDDDGIGVVFRYRNTDNWYRLSLDSQRSYRRLVKCTAGAVSILWEDAEHFAVGEPFSLVIDALGDRLIGHHDGDQIFDLRDADHPSGQIGLYCWGNEGARFNRITVTQPPLDAYAIFRDRFPVGDLSEWTITDEGSAGGAAAWAILPSGELNQTGNTHSPPNEKEHIDKRGTHVVAGDPAWTDIVLSIDLRAGDDDAIGVMLRYQDENNFYRFSMDRQRHYRRLVRCVGGTFTSLWEDDVAFEIGRVYTLVFALAGSRINAWIDGVPLLEVEDDTHAAGRIGLYCWGNEDAKFSNVRVFKTGRLWQRRLISDDFEMKLPGLWTPVTAGTQQGPAVWKLDSGYMRQTSNVWGGDTDPAEIAKPGTINLLTIPEGLGESGIVPGSHSWTDYRLTVRLRSGDNDGIGLVFRYRDEDNWYRFSMDSERHYRRLAKSAGGVVAELWSDNIAYEKNREYLITIDAIDDALVGYVNGVELFSLRDDAIPNGTIGLYCWGNQDARFGSVRVTAATWTPHVLFGLDEERLAAGTRVMVHSGNESDWMDPPIPGVTRRFLANAPDRGWFRLPGNRPLQIRLRDASNEIGHTRCFLPPAEYAAEGGVRLLRKQDGTEFAVFRKGGGTVGSLLPEGQYRLEFSYRRRNTAFDPESIVFSRAGDDSNEMVRLDVPWVVE